MLANIDIFAIVSPRRMKKIFIKTYGCQMNERDSEVVAALRLAFCCLGR